MDKFKVGDRIVSFPNLDLLQVVEVTEAIYKVESLRVI